MIILGILLLLGVVIAGWFCYVWNKRQAFVQAHSIALKELDAINKRYSFYAVPDLSIEWEYDNEDFYHDISELDFLTYRLASMQDDVKLAIKNAAINRTLYEKYLSEIAAIKPLGRYDEEFPFGNEGKLIDVERSLFENRKKKAKLLFSIRVTIRLTNRQGEYRTYKQRLFLQDEILLLIKRVNSKKGTFYLDSQVWQSICRVERGMVTNKLRFSVYERDHYRCQRCGRENSGLEIDHIIPISKGGKSVMHNLQTLCRDCNLQKSNKIELATLRAASNSKNDLDICPLCGHRLKKKYGKYGLFLGCSSYPNCRFKMDL